MNYLKMHATSSSQESYLHIERIEIVVSIPGKELKQIYNISTKIWCTILDIVYKLKEASSLIFQKNAANLLRPA
jgi:hypothetical protein